MKKVRIVARVGNIECDLHPGLGSINDLRDEVDRLIGLCNGDKVQVIEIVEVGHLEKTRFCEGRQEKFQVDSSEEQMVATYQFKKVQAVGAYELVAD